MGSRKKRIVKIVIIATLAIWVMMPWLDWGVYHGIGEGGLYSAISAISFVTAHSAVLISVVVSVVVCIMTVRKEMSRVAGSVMIVLCVINMLQSQALLALGHVGITAYACLLAEFVSCSVPFF